MIAVQLWHFSDILGFGLGFEGCGLGLEGHGLGLDLGLGVVALLTFLCNGAKDRC